MNERSLGVTLRSGANSRCMGLLDRQAGSSRTRRDVNPTRLEQAKRFVVDGLASGAMKPVIARTFEFDEIVGATRFMESNARSGRS